MDRSGDGSGDPSGDPSGDGRWLSYDELARARRISKASAERLVFRRHWRRQRGNDHVTRALVPAEFLTGDPPPDASGDASPDLSPDARDLLAGALTALEDAVASMREQLAGAERRAETAEAGREGERARADALRERIEGLTGELAAARDAADRARAEAQAAQDAAAGLRRQDDERKAQGRWARIRAAWRGR